MSFLYSTLLTRGIFLVCQMNLVKIFSLGIMICSISGSYSNSVSITLDFIHGKEYKVSMSSDSINRSETFYKIEEFPQKLNDVTDGLLSAESVSINNITRHEFIVDSNQALCLHFDPNNNNTSNVNSGNNGLNLKQIIFQGVNSNNSKPVKLFVNGTGEPREEIVFFCGKNIVDFPDITVKNLSEMLLHTRLDCVVTYYDHPLYNHIAFANKSFNCLSIKPNERKGFTTTLNYKEYSATHNFKTKPSKGLEN